MSLAWVENPIWLIIWTLCAYRLTRLWTRDTLPPVVRLRQAVLNRWGGSPWSELADCPWCAGFWITAATVLLASSPVAPYVRWVAVPLALSAVVGVIASRDE